MTGSPLSEAVARLHIVEVPMSVPPTREQMAMWLEDLRLRVDHPHFVLRWRRGEGK